MKSKSFKSNLEQGVQEKLCSIKNFKNIVLNPPPDSETEKFFKCRGIAFWFFRILTLQILEEFLLIRIQLIDLINQNNSRIVISHGNNTLTVCSIIEMI